MAALESPSNLPGYAWQHLMAFQARERQHLMASKHAFECLSTRPYGLQKEGGRKLGKIVPHHQALQVGSWHHAWPADQDAEAVCTVWKLDFEDEFEFLFFSRTVERLLNCSPG